ncbi:uncharacterized protein [Aegilops tauschii subsp. strangulata]|nr:uncharacterized protein LOC109763320 [Aegilops tauschii subsp. strangulata]XP_044374346.1 uncharacterized protein LOC123096652 [Triticum aestivum]
MDREEMKMVILGQEQTFRQQVHEIHRVYHVQKQVMREMQIAGLNQAHAETKHKLEVWRDDKATDRQQLYSFSNSWIPASAAEECNLELTVATGSSRSHKGKQVGKSSNSYSGMAVSSTSSGSDLARFKEFDTRLVRFQIESKRVHQPVILRMAR